MKAGFAEIDISPLLGGAKIGWMKDINISKILDPIFAKVAIFQNCSEKIAFIQLDTLSIRWTFTNQLRQLIEDKFGFPGLSVMVSATHNHAGPAVADFGLVQRDDGYVETLKNKCLDCFEKALGQMVDVKIGFKSAKCFDVAYNRRVIMRDGTVCTHGDLRDENALCIEGPTDPELALVVVKNEEGSIIGSLINFAVHPTHHGGTEEISAGFPGALAYLMKTMDCPVSLFLNGAYGNLATYSPDTNYQPTKEEVAEKLFHIIRTMMDEMDYTDDLTLNSTSKTITLPYRNASEEEVKGDIKGAQRFSEPAIYDQLNPDFVKWIAERKEQLAEVQVLQLGDYFYVGIPAEYFVEFGLQIKEETYPARSFVVGGANGMIGYVPTKNAFKYGGYETTFAPSSRMGHDAGDRLADTAIELINESLKK